MKLTVAAIWAIPYLVAGAVVLQFSIGFPTSVAPYLAFLICGVLVGGFGIFFTEVSRFIFRDHPIQTTLYGAIVCSLLLSVVTILILAVLFSIFGLVATTGEALGWAFVIFLGLFIRFLLATLASSLISIPFSHASILTRTEQVGDRKPDHVSS